MQQTVDSVSVLHSQIHHQALEISSRYKKCEYELIEVLQEVDSKRIYVEYGFSSLFQYIVNGLRLTESVAYNLTAVCRKSREVPELKEKIRMGEISISNARKIVPILTSANKTEWLQRASQLTQRKLEKEIVKVRPEAETPERARYTTQGRIKLELGLNESEMLKLRRVQEILSQSKRRSVRLEDVLKELTTEYLKRHDPLEKAKRHRIKTNPEIKPSETVKTPVSIQVPEKETTNSDQSTESLPKRELVPAGIKHQVNFRDNRKCTHVHSDGNRCNQTRWLEIHHIKPVKKGGGNELSNLTTLCSVHHRYLHSENTVKQSRGS